MYSIRLLRMIMLLVGVSNATYAARYALLNESKNPVTISLERARFRGKFYERRDEVAYQLNPGEGVASSLVQPRAHKVVLTEYTGNIDRFGQPIRIEQTWEPSLKGVVQLIAIRYQGDGAFLKSDKNLIKLRRIIKDLKNIICQTPIICRRDKTRNRVRESTGFYSGLSSTFPRGSAGKGV